MPHVLPYVEEPKKKQHKTKPFHEHSVIIGAWEEGRGGMKTMADQLRARAKQEFLGLHSTAGRLGFVVI